MNMALYVSKSVPKIKSIGLILTELEQQVPLPKWSQTLLIVKAANEVVENNAGYGKRSPQNKWFDEECRKILKGSQLIR